MTSMTAPFGVWQEMLGGVDTHKATHHAAVLDAGGARVADREFPTTAAGCTALVGWLAGHGVRRVGVEPGLRLMIVGMDRSPVARDLERQVRDHGLGPVTRFVPFVGAQELNEIFNAADLGIWPAMPAITIQQAMGTGLRVLVPENDLVSHLVRSPVNGSTYRPSPTDAGPLIRALADTLAVAHTLDDRRATATANSWLSTSAVADRLLSLIPPR